MDDETKTSLAIAIAGGYILGRTKKGRLALTTATLLFGRRLGLDPQRLAAQGVRRLRAVPQVSELEEQVRTEGLDAARQALSSVVGRGMGSITDEISSRLPGGSKGQGDGDQDDEDAPEHEESEERPARRRRRAADAADADESATTRPARSAARKRNTAKRAERPVKKSAARRAAPAADKAKPAKRAPAPGKKAASAKHSARSAGESARSAGETARSASPRPRRTSRGDRD
ncbi:histone protein [Streptomyces sp. 8L]|uniref:histone protein n=1 Tax=Streptomyces sp. 8L TaxID=2877242 RepID=UPI001CD56452|nr:histone protein [Streptomyces sp. 8L]MCA1220581.1 histone protein [Streptomyces sp. 8L]